MEINERLTTFPSEVASSFALKVYIKAAFCGLFCLTPRKATTVSNLFTKQMKTIFADGGASGHLGQDDHLTLPCHLGYPEQNTQYRFAGPQKGSANQVTDVLSCLQIPSCHIK